MILVENLAKKMFCVLMKKNKTKTEFSSFASSQHKQKKKAVSSGEPSANKMSVAGVGLTSAVSGSSGSSRGGVKVMLGSSWTCGR